VGIPSLFYGVENLLHPAYAPGVPLQKLTPEWIPGRIFLSCFVGVTLIVAGVCLLVNKKTRIAATSLGLTILVTVLWIYLPMLLRAPTDVVALNYFRTLLSGAILLLANAMTKNDVCGLGESERAKKWPRLAGTHESGRLSEPAQPVCCSLFSLRFFAPVLRRILR
jgi:uncharacterized membrane protein YphA (DoxX/SURF4 family)